MILTLIQYIYVCIFNTNTVSTNFRIIRTNIYRNSGPYNGFPIVINFYRPLVFVLTRFYCTLYLRTSHGTISTGYTRNQFDVCPFRVSAYKSGLTSTVSQTQAMQSASLGLISGSACRCKHCKTLRCPCKKSGRSCNSKCHKGHTCFNKFI